MHVEYLVNGFPWVSLARALAVLRVSVAVVFLAHAIMRVVNGHLLRFARFVGEAGVPFAIIVVWLITSFEVGGGVLLLATRHVRLLSAEFSIMLVGGILLIHRHFGWFVGQPGRGGSEYSVVLLAAVVVSTAGEQERTSTS